MPLDRADDAPAPRPAGLSGPGRPADRDTFCRCWLAERHDVEAWAAGHLGSSVRTELPPDDFLQEVACRAWQCFHRFDPERASFHAWVRGIAHNVLRESLRRRALRSEALRRRPTPPDERGIAPDPAVSLALEEDLARFVERLGRLGVDERALLLGRGVEGLSPAELACRLHTTPAAVSKRWQRLCRRLRREPEAGSRIAVSR